LKKTAKVTKGVISFRLVSAECMTMDEMHAFMDWRSGPFSGPDVTERTMAHRPGLLRIFVLDVSGLLPIPLDGYTLPTDISNWPPTYHRRYDPKWREHLFELFGQPLHGRQNNSDDEDDGNTDDDEDNGVGYFEYPADIDVIPPKHPTRTSKIEVVEQDVDDATSSVEARSVRTKEGEDTQTV